MSSYVQAACCSALLGTQKTIHQTAFTPEDFYTSKELHQTFSMPDHFYTSYTKQFLHQGTFTLSNCYSKQFLHQTVFTSETFTTLSPHNFYTRRLSRQKFVAHPFKQKDVYTEKLQIIDFDTRSPSHQTIFTAETFHTKSLYTKQLLYQRVFTPEGFDTKKHQTTVTPEHLYTKEFYTKQFLHRRVSTPEGFSQTTLTPEYFYTKQPLHQTTLLPIWFLHQKTLTQ